MPYIRARGSKTNLQMDWENKGSQLTLGLDPQWWLVDSPNLCERGPFARNHPALPALSYPGHYLSSTSFCERGQWQVLQGLSDLEIKAGESISRVWKVNLSTLSKPLIEPKHKRALKIPKQRLAGIDLLLPCQPYLVTSVLDLTTLVAPRIHGAGDRQYKLPKLPDPGFFVCLFVCF